ncbi:MAG TPA: hypothetical protein VF744_15940 [Beijerinckiaceae bacterium]|jgi:hypothetical protein
MAARPKKLSPAPDATPRSAARQAGERETVLVDDFAAAFGPGYRFLRATVEIVPAGIWPLNAIGLSGEPVTQNIVQRLPWVSSIRGYLSGDFACNPNIGLSCLDVGHFKRGG